VKDVSAINPFAFQNSNISTTQEPPVNRLRAPTTLLVTTKSPILISLVHLYVFTRRLLEASYLRLHRIPNVLLGDTFLRSLYFRTVFIKSAQGHIFVPRSFFFQRAFPRKSGSPCRTSVERPGRDPGSESGSTVRSRSALLLPKRWPTS
jgi:hypothetical protein